MHAELLRRFRKNKDLTQRDLAEKLGVSLGLIGMIENGERTISKRLNERIKEVFNCDLLKEAQKQSESDYMNVIAIPLYEIGAAAGKGTQLDEEPEQRTMYFDKRFLKVILNTDNFEHLHIIHASGDSMDSGWNQPSDIKDGDLLLVDTSQTSGNNQVFVILVNNQELRVKKLFKHGDTLYISSNNPKYPEETYTPDNSDVEISVIGKVVWHGSKERL